MKENKNNTRDRWLHLRLTASEYRLIHGRFSKTTCRKLSEYVRSVIFEKPVISTYRNASVDGFMAEMAVLNKELNAIGHNINQVTKKMHTLQVPEWQQWHASYQLQGRIFFDKAEEIKGLLQILTERWLR